jgi:hypothetical protein
MVFLRPSWKEIQIQIDSCRFLRGGIYTIMAPRINVQLEKLFRQKLQRLGADQFPSNIRQP